MVVEVRGRVLSEAEYEELADPSYVVSFDDKLLQLKQQTGDDIMCAAIALAPSPLRPPSLRPIHPPLRRERRPSSF